MLTAAIYIAPVRPLMLHHTASHAVQGEGPEGRCDGSSRQLCQPVGARDLPATGRANTLAVP